MLNAAFQLEVDEACGLWILLIIHSPPTTGCDRLAPTNQTATAMPQRFPRSTIENLLLLTPALRRAEQSQPSRQMHSVVGRNLFFLEVRASKREITCRRVHSPVAIERIMHHVAEYCLGDDVVEQARLNGRKRRRPTRNGRKNHRRSSLVRTLDQPHRELRTERHQGAAPGLPGRRIAEII